MNNELDFSDYQHLPEQMQARMDYSIDPLLAIFRARGKEVQQLLDMTGWWPCFKQELMVQEKEYPYFAGGFIKDGEPGRTVYGLIALYMPDSKTIYRRLLLVVPKPGYDNDETCRRLTEALVWTFKNDYGNNKNT